MVDPRSTDPPSPSPVRPTVVVGGTGRTGRLVVDLLVERALPVRVLTRRPPAGEPGGRAVASANGRATGGRSGVQLVRGDLTDPERLREAALGVGAVVVVVESGNDDTAPDGPDRVHHLGTQNVLATTDPDVHVVMVSQIYVTRPEMYPQVAATIAARRRGEQVLRDSARPYTIVRPSWLTDSAAGQLGLRFEQGDTGDGRVSRADVAQTIVQCLLHPQQAARRTFEVYNDADGWLPTPRADAQSTDERWADRLAALRPDPAGGG